MVIESDMLVVGDGLTGMASAVAIIREDVMVRLVSHKKTTPRQTSGLVNVLGYVPSRDSTAEGVGYVIQRRVGSRAVRSNRDVYQEPLVKPTDGFDDLPADHLYSLVGESALRDGLTLFDDLTDDAYHDGYMNHNALLPAFDGTVRPTARYPRVTAKELASGDRPMLVVDFRSFANSDTRMLVDSPKAADVPLPAADIKIELVEEFRVDASVARIARALSHDEYLDGIPAKQMLVDTVRPYIDRAKRVGFSAVLDDGRADTARAALSERLGIDVFGTPMGPPSLPSLRLGDRLCDTFDAKGVLCEVGNPVVNYETDGESGYVDAMLIDREGREVPYAADSFILTTGGLVGKGFDSDRTAVKEPVFDCRASQPSDHYDWFADDTFGTHPYTRLNVESSAKMRPPAANGTLEFENLFVAGTVASSANIARERSATGVFLATGVVAGRNAAEEPGDWRRGGRRHGRPDDDGYDPHTGL